MPYESPGSVDSYGAILFDVRRDMLGEINDLMRLHSECVQVKCREIVNLTSMCYIFLIGNNASNELFLDISYEIFIKQSTLYILCDSYVTPSFLPFN